MTHPTPAIDRLLPKIAIDPDTECWIWRGALARDGYGTMLADGSRTNGTRRLTGTHRVSYEHFVGPIPDGYQIDHLCRVPACCCPWHLEAVTQQENIRRGRLGILRGT